MDEHQTFFVTCSLFRFPGIRALGSSVNRGCGSALNLSPSALAIYARLVVVICWSSRCQSSREVCMITFTRIIVRLWVRDPDFRSLVFLVFLTLLIGTIFYSVQEGWSVIDAFYFSVTTLTTVGYGDLTPKTPIGKLFTVGYILSGLGLIAGFINAIAEENLSRRTRRQRNGGDQEDTGDA